MSIININEHIKLHKDEYQYQIEYFKAGGKQVRNPSTGGFVTTKDQWVRDTTYHSTLDSALKRVVNLKLLAVEEYNDLQSYLEDSKILMNNLLANLKS